MQLFWSVFPKYYTMSDDNTEAISVSAETAIIFFAVLFIAFCCGFVRSIRQHFVVKRQAIANLHRLQRRNILITHINLPENTRSRNDSLDDDVRVTLPGIFVPEEQLRPPPYTAAVSNIQPPSYDEAIRLQTTQRTPIVATTNI